MAHARNRYVLALVTKKLKVSPILILQGARQVGKSFLARELIPKLVTNSKYKTLDIKEDRVFANENPDSFVASFDLTETAIVDEAQKAPDLFDAVKASVDHVKRPGRFILLGSTEFSHLTKVRESLTGRVTRMRIFPFTLAESQHLDMRPSLLSFPTTPRATRHEIMTYLERGGLPGIFAVRNESERIGLFQDWVDTMLQRDIFQIKSFRPDPDIAARILQLIAEGEVSDLTNFAKKVGCTTQRFKSHIEALKTLFVIHEIKPCVGSTGGPIYRMFDTGVAHFLGADFATRLRTWIQLELLAHLAYSDDKMSRVEFYRTSKGKRIDFIVKTRTQTTAILVLEKESIKMTDLEILRAYKIKFPTHKLVVLGATRLSLPKDKIEIYPWEALI